MKRITVLLNLLIYCTSLLAPQVGPTQSARVPPRESQVEQQERQQPQLHEQWPTHEQGPRQANKSPYLTSDESHEALMRTATTTTTLAQQPDQQLAYEQQRESNQQQAVTDTTLRVQQHREQPQRQQRQSQAIPATAVRSMHPIRVDKRSWSPRASRTQETKEDEAVSLLLEEVASLDIDTAGGSVASTGSPGQEAAQAAVIDETGDKSAQLSPGASSTPSSGPNSGSRLRGISSFMMTGNQSGRAGSQSVVNGSRPSVSTAPYRVGTMGAEFPKRTNNRHLPCFFNAIACF